MAGQLHLHGPLRTKRGAVEGEGFEGNCVKGLTKEHILGPK